MSSLVTILVAIFNAVGPGVIDLIKQAMAHPALDEQGRAAADALAVAELRRDRADVLAEQPLPAPKPAAPG
jgi:hypothetical protein